MHRYFRKVREHYLDLDELLGKKYVLLRLFCFRSFQREKLPLILSTSQLLLQAEIQIWSLDKDAVICKSINSIVVFLHSLCIHKLALQEPRIPVLDRGNLPEWLSIRTRLIKQH